MLGLRIQFTEVSIRIGDQLRLHRDEGLSGPAPAPFPLSECSDEFQNPICSYRVTTIARHDGKKITLFLFTNSNDSCTRGCMCVVNFHLIYWYTKNTEMLPIYQQWYKEHRVWLQDIENYDFYLKIADM